MAGVGAHTENDPKHAEQEAAAPSPSGPTSIAELPEYLQDVLDVVKTDPKNFGHNFAAVHARAGTARKTEEERSQLEVKYIAEWYLTLLNECGGEKAPDEAKELLLDAAKDALGARGIEVSSHEDVLSVTRGPRQDEILDFFGQEGRLRSQLSELFDPTDGMLRAKEDLTEAQALRGIGISGETASDLFARFGSLNEFMSALQHRLTQHVENIENFLDGKGVEGETRKNVNEIIGEGIKRAAEFIERAASVHFEHSRDPERDENKAEARKADPKENKPDSDAENKARETNKAEHKKQDRKPSTPNLKDPDKPSLWKAIGLGGVAGVGVWSYFLLAVQPAIHAAAGATAASIAATVGTWAVASAGVGLGVVAGYLLYAGIRNGIRKVRQNRAKAAAASE